LKDYPSPGLAAKYRADSSILIESWGDESIVYNPRSGETHQLNELAVEALKIMQAQSVSLTSLTHEICAVFLVEDQADLTNQLVRLIGQLDSLGLIEPAASES